MVTHTVSSFVQWGEINILLARKVTDLLDLAAANKAVALKSCGLVRGMKGE